MPLPLPEVPGPIFLGGHRNNERAVRRTAVWRSRSAPRSVAPPRLPASGTPARRGPPSLLAARNRQPVRSELGEWKSGRPGRCRPGLPRIRTCGTTASGSSVYGFAIRARLRVVARHRALLSEQLALRRFGARWRRLRSAAWFHTSALASLLWVPTASVPRTRRYYRALRLLTGLCRASFPSR